MDASMIHKIICIDDSHFECSCGLKVLCPDRAGASMAELHILKTLAGVIEERGIPIQKQEQASYEDHSKYYCTSCEAYIVDGEGHRDDCWVVEASGLISEFKAIPGRSLF